MGPRTIERFYLAVRGGRREVPRGSTRCQGKLELAPGRVAVGSVRMFVCRCGCRSALGVETMRNLEPPGSVLL